MERRGRGGPSTARGARGARARELGEDDRRQRPARRGSLPGRARLERGLRILTRGCRADGGGGCALYAVLRQRRTSRQVAHRLQAELSDVDRSCRILNPCYAGGLDFSAGQVGGAGTLGGRGFLERRQHRRAPAPTESGSLAGVLDHPPETRPLAVVHVSADLTPNRLREREVLPHG